MEIALVAVVGALCIACFFIGAKVGQAVSKGETIEAPTVNPLREYKEHQAKKENEMEQRRLDVIMQNVENYDGTSRHQEDVPGR